MVVISVAYVFGWLFACLAASMLIPLAFALVQGELAEVRAFLATATGTGFLGGALILALKEQQQESGRKEGLFLLGVIWFIIPVVAAFPFYFAKVPEDFLKAYFEAVSGFTTTGATIFVDVSELPNSIIVWRALLQWMGGLTTLLTLAAILAPVVAADDVEGGFRQFKHTTSKANQHILMAIPMILPIYFIMTLGCFLLLVFTKIPIFDAFCLSLSTVSTGGFMPRPGSIALYGSPAAELVLSLFMFLGAVSIVWVSALSNGRFRVVVQLREPWWIGAVILIFGLLLSAVLLIQSPEKNVQTFYYSVTAGVMTIASFVSTTGFLVSSQTKELLPYIIVILLCIVGGGRLSTAGGLKFFRIQAMFKQSSRELMQLVFPHGVRPANFSSANMESMIMRSVWANFALIIMALWLMTAVVSITGLPLSAAFLASVSAISNIGPAYTFTSLPDLTTAQSYAAMHPGAHAALCLGMILGRVEVLALLSVMNTYYWRS